jgi:MerR family transcriptional regulator, light-induced transcriptional regulator
MSTYSIRDLEQLSGIKAHTLRIWEQRYDIIQPKRTDTNIRLYDDSDLKRVLNIALLNEHGYKISKIAQMSEDELRKEVLQITDKSTKTSEQIQALTLAMIDLDEERFEKILSTNVLQIGFERSMTQIIYPFLIKIGFLWQTGAIHPAQEHFMSHLIRLKIMVAIDGQVFKPKANTIKFLMYLPEGELHELSLLFACYLAKSRHHQVIYLGQSTPFQDIVEVYKLHQPQYLMFVATSMPGQDDIQNYINQVCARFEQATVLMTGFQVVGQDLEVPSNGRLIHKIDDLIDLLDDLKH